MYCPYCGAELKADARFCGGCGRTMAGVLATGGVSAGEGASVTTGGTPAIAGVPATRQSQNQPTVQQDQQTIGQNGKGNERRLGILLCVFAPVCCLLSAILNMFGGDMFGGVSLLLASLCLLPLTITLLVVGLKVTRNTNRTDKTKNYQSLFGLALITLAAALLISGSINFSLYVMMYRGYDPGYSLVYIFLLLYTPSMIAAAILLFVVASRKKKAGVSGNSFMAAAILILVSVALGIIPDFCLVWFGWWEPAPFYLLLILSNLVFPIVIIILGAGMIPKKQRVVATQTPYYNQQSIQVGYAQDAPSIGFAFLGFFIPLVGLILFLVWKDQFPLKAKSCGKGALIALIVGGSITVLTIIALVIAFVVMGL